ncbi:MAG: hypothetical protein LBJ02_06470 [Bifidobacteriaceae bacterium]|nr:hypothetical protein [Bifidobacteriaceae bacterium]
MTCGVGACDGGGTAAEPQILAVKDQSHWTLPLDPYLAPHWAFELYAVDLLAEECMTARGLSENPMIPYDPNAPDPATHNGAGRRLFDPEIAAVYGYRWDPPLKYDRLRALELNATMGQEIAEAQTACEQQVYKGLDIERQDDWVLGTTASFAPKADQVVVEAARKWHDCMGDLGVTDLPATPSEFPTTELWARWGLDDQSGDGGDDPMYDSPVPEEIDYAVKDAGCQESSGWAQAYYEVEWRLQAEYVEKNFGKLEKQRAENESRVKLFKSIIDGSYQETGR